jgi:hypothetical protein
MRQGCSSVSAQQRLNLRPLPHGHGAFRNRALIAATVRPTADGIVRTPGVRSGPSRLRAELESATVAKQDGATRKASERQARSRRARRSRPSGRHRLGEQLEQTEAQRLADSDWIEWGGELIWAVGFTSGGAPYGLRVCDFDREDLEAMGLDVAALDAAGRLATPESSIDESNDWLRDDDIPF